MPAHSIRLEPGETELEQGDPDYFLPQLLNDLISETEQEARAVFDWLAQPQPDDKLVAAGPEERKQIENGRFHRFRLMLETLTDKHANAAKVAALLQEIEAGNTGFVLLLRGFSLKQHFFRHTTVGDEKDLQEYSARFELARRLAPLPLVLVRNPATSESLLSVFPEADSAAENTFPVDLDGSWESDVRRLAGAASFICVRNTLSTSGLAAELGILQDLGRLEDTFFTDPGQARQAVPNGTIQPLDDAAHARMRGAVARKFPGGRLPQPTCLWLQGHRRSTVRDNVLAVFDLFNRWAAAGQGMPRDVQMRLMSFALAGSVALERLDLLVMSLGSYAQLLGMYSAEQLPGREELARAYFSIAQSIVLAIDQAQAPIFDYQDLDAIKVLMREAEDPDELLLQTRRCVAALRGG